ncbi:MAG: aminotransferase class I/II-fold pyridoxal phosphate-dependent enzyme [Lachnospiraceae bacterium]|nr:aminotransferase class I/II-fold pyridoxal phosphate-dependent enzyme [Lachnospiraceae bacterium]
MFDELIKYAGSDIYPFHMPGHKRRFKGFDPYRIDITEVDGFDDLHKPGGIIQSLNQNLCDYFGGDELRLLINGSTSGVMAAITASVEPGEKLLLCSNCHRSALNAVELRNIEAVFIEPEEIEGSGLKGGIAPVKVREALEGDSGIKAVFITSPTYEGFLSDVRSVAAVCHEKGIPLITDSAHGAHAGMYRPFTDDYNFENASETGADIIIKSLHKNLPAFTQTAVLTVNGSLVNREKLWHYYSVFQSTSPSYVLMAGADRMLTFLRAEGEKYFAVLNRELKDFHIEAGENDKIELAGAGFIGKYGIYGFDPTKLLLSHRDMDAGELYRSLREDFHLQPERISGRYVLLMTSLMDEREGFSRLKRAVRELK